MTVTGWAGPAAFRTLASLCAVALLTGCTQTAGTPTPAIAAAGAPNTPSVTAFTLAVAPDSVTGCILAEGLDRPMTLTVTNDRAVLLTAGGIHYDLQRLRPNVYAGGYWIKIEADLSVRPRRLTVHNDDNSCRWVATAP
jgi:hypothetical protein